MLQGSVGTSWHQKNPSFHFVLFTVFSSYELHQYRVFLIIQLNCIDGEILKLLQIFLVTVPHFSGCCCRISFPGNCFSAVLMLQLQHKSTVFPAIWIFLCKEMPTAVFLMYLLPIPVLVNFPSLPAGLAGLLVLSQVVL